MYLCKCKHVAFDEGSRTGSAGVLWCDGGFFFLVRVAAGGFVYLGSLQLKLKALRKDGISKLVMGVSCSSTGERTDKLCR